MPLGQQIHFHYILGNACSLRAVPLSRFCFVPYYEETLNCKKVLNCFYKISALAFLQRTPTGKKKRQKKKNWGCHLERGHRNNKVLCFWCLQHRWHQLGSHPQGEWEISPDSKKSEEGGPGSQLDKQQKDLFSNNVSGPFYFHFALHYLDGWKPSVHTRLGSFYWNSA